MSLIKSFFAGVLKALLVSSLIFALAFPYVLIHKLLVIQKKQAAQLQEINDNQIEDSAFLGQVALLTILLSQAVSGQGESIQQLQDGAIEQSNQVQKVVNDTNVKLNKLSDTVKTSNEKPSYEYLKSVTVMIFQESKEEPGTFHGSLGTGVILKNKEGHSYILTNKHVCNPEEGGPCFVIQKDNGEITKTEVKPFKVPANNYDAQILESKTVIEGKTEIKGIAHAQPQDPVYLVGHHLGRPYIYGEGVFGGYEEKFIDVIQIPILWGDSGSGVFDKDGRLVALMFAGNAEEQEGIVVWDTAHGLAVDSDVIAYLCKGIL